MDIIVPIKRFSDAKTRLAGLFTGAEREALAQLLAATVLEQLAQVRNIRRVIVLSSEPSIGRLIAGRGFDLLGDDPRFLGLNPAIARAVEHAVSSGAGDIGVVFSDLPLFTAETFGSVVDEHLGGGPRKVTLAPDRFGVGTNVRLCRPGDLLSPLYGRNSASEYWRAATACGAELRIATSTPLSHDVDQPDDIAAILALRPKHIVPPPFLPLFERWTASGSLARSGQCA